MPEQGTTYDTDRAGGMIKASTSPDVSYSSGVVSGSMPVNSQTVCFERSAADLAVASYVRIGTCAVAALAEKLEASFAKWIKGATLTAGAHNEISRIANDRAKRILGSSADAQNLPNDVKDARLELAHAAMKFMAIEAKNSAAGDIVANDLRKALRGQRPRLPR